MNRVLLIGNVCAKPEQHTTQNGVNRSSFKLAVQRKYKNESGNYDADFLPVIAWRQTADYCNQYLDKGSKIAVEGTIQTRSYTAQDGSKRTVTEIIADRVEGLGKPREAATGDAKTEKPGWENFEQVDAGDDLPF